MIRTLLLTVMALGSASAFAANCTDFSGAYAFEETQAPALMGLKCVITIQQTACEKFDANFKCPDAGIEANSSARFDGIFRQPSVASAAYAEAYQMIGDAMVADTVMFANDGTNNISKTKLQSSKSTSRFDANRDIVSTTVEYDSSGNALRTTVQKLTRIK